jgi:hypothetical protein
MKKETSIDRGLVLTIVSVIAYTLLLSSLFIVMNNVDISRFGAAATALFSDYTNPLEQGDGTATGASREIATDSSTSLTANAKTAQPLLSCPKANSVTVTSSLSDGTKITGEYMQIRLNGNVVQSGYSPVTFCKLQPKQQYQVVAYWFGESNFRHWSDGVLLRYHQAIAGPNPVNLTAVYEKIPSALSAQFTVKAVLTNGTEIGGTTSLADGSIVAKPGMYLDLTLSRQTTPYTAAFTGSSTLPFTLLKGQTYTITMYSDQKYKFDHWQDNGSKNPVRSFKISGDSLNNIAVYRP